MSSRAKYERWATQAARHYGVPVGVFKAMITHESGWNAGARSPAGAVGIAQFMPDTARGLGINPLNPRQALFGAAKHLRGLINEFGDVRLALAAYNAGAGAVKKYGGVPPFAETQRYVKVIMGDAHKYGPSPGAPAAADGFPHKSGYDVTMPEAPDFKSAALTSLTDAASHGGYIDPISSLGNLVSAIQSAGSTTVHVPGAPLAKVANAHWQKYVKLAAGADRAGVSTSPAIEKFIGRLGAALRRRLTITTGTNHNQFVVGTNRQSAHWTGHAVDVAMSGRALTRAGQRALILAGMPAAQARKIHGGLFNIGGYQIIFNTNEGGNHYNHLHVGLRG